MKKTILSLLAAVACMSINAQVIKVYKSGTTDPVATYTNTSTDQYKVVFEEAPAADANLLPGEFSVSATKKVSFTKGNLWCNTTASPVTYAFEANQYDYPTTWDTSHVGNFYWTTTAAASYAQVYSGSPNGADKFWLDGSDADHKLTVNGTTDLYVLSVDEWDYLINSRSNTLYKRDVTVAGKTNCLIIAPDDYAGTIADSYTAETWVTAEAAGLVCLPAAGNTAGNGSNGIYYYSGSGSSSWWGSYWSSSQRAYNTYGYKLWFTQYNFYTNYEHSRYEGNSLRLVK